MNRFMKSLAGGLFPVFLTLAILWAGCEEGAPPTGVVGVASVSALTIIPNPLTPQPGELTRLTVLVTSSGAPPSTQASYKWQVSGGILDDDEGIVVDWQAPDTTGLYRVTVVVKLEQDSDTLSKDIAVRYFEAIDINALISVQPTIIGEDLFYLASDRSPDEEGLFFGYTAYRYRGEGALPLKLTNCPDGDPCNGGYDMRFYGELGKGLGSMVTGFLFGVVRQPAMNIIIFPFIPFMGIDRITEDASGVGSRRDQNRYAYGNDDLSMIVWQKHKAGLNEAGTADLYNIRFWKDGDTYMTLTESHDSFKVVTPVGDTLTKHRYYDNTRPMFTKDEDFIVYFTDSSGNFEPCLIPIIGGEPDTSNGKRRALTGLFETQGIKVSEATIFQWNPVGNELGFVDENRQLCFFDYLMETVANFNHLGSVYEMVWSPDGSECAVVTDKGISIVTPSSMSDIEVFEKENEDDEIFGVNWSEVHHPDDKLLGFRLYREGKGAVGAYSSLIFYSHKLPGWYYVSPRVDWRKEPSVDYKMMRVVFDANSEGIYAPIPVNETGKETKIFHSYD